MQRWEYCVIQADQKVMLFPDGIKVEPIHKDKGDDSVLTAKLRLIAQMGSDGWEMVNFERSSPNSDYVYWFKRLVVEQK